MLADPRHPVRVTIPYVFLLQSVKVYLFNSENKI